MSGNLPSPRWVVQRVLLSIPVIIGVTSLTFAVIHLAPGDPIYVLAGDAGTASYYAEMRAKYGLDRPLGEQFIRYARAVATGDFGYSFMFQSPVRSLLIDHAAASLLLGLTSLAIATLVGCGAGALCALTRSRTLDAVVRAAASVAYAAPVFWTGQVFVIVAAVKLGWLPVGGMSTARESLDGTAHLADVGRHLVLPALTLALPFAAVVARVSRAAVREGLREPYVTAVYARGLSAWRVVTRHVVPNAVVPVVALVGQHAAQIVASAALTEALFGWPGIGYLVLHASLHRDYPLVTAAFIVISSSVVLVNAIADAACGWLDPRIRLT